MFEETHPFIWFDYVIFISMLVVSMCAGLYHAFAGGGQTSTAKFLMADRSMKSLPVAISVLVSYLSALTILGIPSEVYTHGIQYWLVVWSFCITIPVTVFVFLPVFHGLGLTSAYDYLQKRFSLLVSSIGASLFIAQTLSYLAVVLYAPTLALNVVTKFPPFGTVLVMGGVCTVYTALGGIKAVIWTDVFQFAVLFVSLVALLIIGIAQSGGMEYILQYNHEKGHLNFLDFSPDPTHRLSFWSLILGGSFNSLTVWAVSQISVQRFLTARNLKEAKRSVWFALPATIIVISIVSAIGLILFAFYDAALINQMPPPHHLPEYRRSDQILVHFVSMKFGTVPGIQGLFIACLFAATLSTVSSGLNALAAVTLINVIQPWRSHRRSNSPVIDEIPLTGATSSNEMSPTTDQSQDRRDMLISKMLTVGYGVLSVGLAFVVAMLGSLIQVANMVLGGVGGPLLGVFSLGILYRRANTGGALLGLLVGFCLSLWLTIGAATHQDEHGNIRQDAFVLYRLSFMWYSTFTSLATFIVGIIVSEIIRYHIHDERYRSVDPLLLATFLRPKGLHNVHSDLQICGDSVFQSLISSVEHDENDSLLGDVEGSEGLELGSVQFEVDHEVINLQISSE